MNNYTTRKNKETNIAKLIGQGDALPYRHSYMGGTAHADHYLELPDALAKLATTAPEAEVIEFGGGSLGIEINGKTWAVEESDMTHGTVKGMPHEVWQYLNLAMGREIDGVRFGDTTGA